MAIAIKIYEKLQYTIKRQCYSGQLPNIEFVHELFNDCPYSMYNMFHMDKKVHIRLFYTLENLHLLKYDMFVLKRQLQCAYIYCLMVLLYRLYPSIFNIWLTLYLHT